MMLFIAMIFVSVIAISAVSAADNLTDVVTVSNVEDSNVIAVDNDDEIINTTVEDSNVIAVDNDDEKISTDVVEKENILSDNSTSSPGSSTFDISSLFNGTTFTFGNGTTFDLSSLFNGTTITFGNGTTFNTSSLLTGNLTFGNGTTFNISSLLNGSTFGNSSFDISGILDLLGGNTKQDSINSTDLTKYYTKNTIFKVTVKNGNDTLTKGTVVFTIDNKEYTGHIGSDGVASVNIPNLKPGTHYMISEYGQVVVKNVIKVKKAVITKDVTKKFKRLGKFNVKILNSKGKAYAKQTVKITFRGKNYFVKTNKNGIATFKLSKNLKVGKYVIRTTYAGLTVSNKIIVRR